MIAFFTTFVRLFLQAFRSKGNLLSENALLKKENEILARKMGKKRVHFGFYDKLFLVVLNRAADIKHRLTLVKPETLLHWQRTLTKRFWTFRHAPAKRGRKPVDTDVKNLILSMKNDNLLWGVKREHGSAVEASCFKRLEILGDSYAGDIGAHPHPEDARLCTLWRRHRQGFRVSVSLGDSDTAGDKEGGQETRGLHDIAFSPGRGLKGIEWKSPTAY